jgi:hypothetical protein
MKKILNYLSILLLTITIFSCSEADKPIDKVRAETTAGGALRTLAVGSPAIALGNAAARFEVTLEIQDVNNGTNTDKIDMFVTFRDNSPLNGSNPRPEVLLKSIPSSAFTTGPRGLPNAILIATIAELKTRLSLTDAQFTGGDQFVVRLAQVLKDGRVFTFANSNANIVGGVYFSSPYFYNANVVCPITESLAGVHTYVTTNMRRGPSGAGVACGGTATGSVTFTMTPTPGLFIISDMSFGMLPSSCWSDTPAFSAGANPSRIRWFCNNLVSSGVDHYGDAYTYTITAATGSTITLNWTNTYNDRGTTVLTREGGANWPAIFAR